MPMWCFFEDDSPEVVVLQQETPRQPRQVAAYPEDNESDWYGRWRCPVCDTPQES